MVGGRLVRVGSKCRKSVGWVYRDKDLQIVKREKPSPQKVIMQVKGIPRNLGH